MAYPYTLKHSSRARRLSLRASVEHGLVVTVPFNYPPRRLEHELARSQAWIERTMPRIERERALALPDSFETDPREVHLRALDLDYAVVSEPGRGTSLRLLEKGDALFLRGPASTASARAKTLRAWLQKRAKSELARLLKDQARQMGLSYRGLRIAAQKTRWGSCSARNGISLNRGLLFFPPELARYVLIHELAHTVHKNHGLRFWALVARFEPEWKQRRGEARLGWRYIPRWAQNRA